MAEPLFEQADWTFDTLRRTYDVIEEVALGDLGLDVYPNQIEVISSEQMLDAYSSIGMPLMYRHWSFGKRFLRDEHLYRRGFQGLAYEIVINSNPCISYNMEESTMAIQALVMAHAAFGHNHFFKNNNLFRQWTDAEGILEYLEFAKSYVMAAEERNGVDAVEEILDAAHALMDQGVFRYRRPPRDSEKRLKRKAADRQAYEEQIFNDLWRTVPTKTAGDEVEHDEELRRRKSELKLPQENLLYFIEKFSPGLNTWERELLRIVRNIAQYFYPQKQTKVMNEGCATFVHYHIMQTLYDRGLLTDGAMFEILQSHTNVIIQPAFDDPRFAGINPYALGFNMMQDIQRICSKPSDEDRRWFPDIAGNGDWRATLREAWSDYRDESFIQQFLSPHLMRKMRLFHILDEEEASEVSVESIHNERGYRAVRRALAQHYDLGANEPDIQVVDVDLKGDRTLKLCHRVRDGVRLEESNSDRVLAHLRRLWGYEVELDSIDASDEKTHHQVESAPHGMPD